MGDRGVSCTTSILILAAGASRRFGRLKQTEFLGEETLLARAVRVAREAALGPVRVVLRQGDEATLRVAEELSCDVVFNAEADEGIASSVRAGVGAVASISAAVVLMTCDQPAVTAAHLRRLAEHGGEAAVASRYGGRCGVPAWFSARLFAELLALRGDQGARDLLQHAPTVELPGGELDIDTPGDLDAAKMRF